VARNRDRCYGACVNDPFDSSTPRRIEQLSRAFHVAFVDFFGMSGPEPVISRDVEDAVDAAHRAFDGSCIAQIALGALDRQVG
jgi:hypothetical protein